MTRLSDSIEEVIGFSEIERVPGDEKNGAVTQKVKAEFFRG